MPETLTDLLTEVRSCRACPDLPLGPNPIMRVHPAARILLVGQAPGTRVHATGIPWNDPSGDRLRDWLGVSRERFYDERLFAIIPMGLCYPGKGKSGDLPPRPECAPRWAGRLLAHLPNRRLTLLIGHYAQAYYLGERRRATLTDTVRHWRDYAPDYLPLPHPSPRNRLWLKKNPWFEEEVVPELRRRIAKEEHGYVSITA